MQMHDYVRKPRGRKVFSGRRKKRRGVCRPAQKTDEEESEGARTRNEKESKGNEIMYATGTRAFSRSLFLPFISLTSILFSLLRFVFHTLFHLSNLNAHRRLSLPRLAVLSTEITSELMDLWLATRRD